MNVSSSSIKSLQEKTTEAIAIICATREIFLRESLEGAQPYHQLQVIVEWCIKLIKFHGTRRTQFNS